MNVDSLEELQDFVQQITSNFLKNLLFTVPITHTVKWHVKNAVAFEAKVYDQSMTRANYNKEATAPSPLTEMSQIHCFHYEKKR